MYLLNVGSDTSPLRSQDGDTNTGVVLSEFITVACTTIFTSFLFHLH